MKSTDRVERGRVGRAVAEVSAGRFLDVGIGGPGRRETEGLRRRDFLRIGGLTPLGLSLAGLLRAESARSDDSHGRAPRPRARSVILVFLGGGLSHHDTFDLKPRAPAEIRGKYSEIPTTVPGLRVGELLPRMARVMHHVALVRSGSHHNDHHETATNWVLSGRFGSPFGDYPAMGAVVAHDTGFAGALPPYVSVPRNPSFTWELGKSAFLGGRYESFKAGDPSVDGYRVRDLSAPADLADRRARRRRRLLAAFDRFAEDVEGSDPLETYDEFQRRAAEMIVSKDTQSAFRVDDEAAWVRDRFGRTTFGQSCLLARRLVERGVRFVTINSGGWDHHARIFPGLESKLPDFDRGFSALVEDLLVRGLLEETLVVAMGEFGRTPKINKDVGRDHWGRAASLVFAGAGVRGGAVIGATDAHGAEVTERPVAPADVAYTIYDALGIDPRRSIHTPDGRPMAILDEGERVSELYG